jgi:hypothetical protein
VVKADELLSQPRRHPPPLLRGDEAHLLLREIEAEDLDEEVMDDFLHAVDQVFNVLYRIERKRHKRLGTEP